MGKQQAAEGIMDTGAAVGYTSQTQHPGYPADLN